MALMNARPLRFSPVGLSDALAEEDAFPGACSILQNLIPDPSTKNVWTPRPAAVQLTSFGTFTTPTGVSVFKIVGSYAYGMVSSAHFAGKDEPFCFNLLTDTFVSVTGANSGNVPTTQSTSGDWTPPTMDVMGTFLVVTHPGFDGVTNFIGWFDITNLAAPVWHAGNFSLVSPLVSVTVSFAGSGYTNGTYTNVPLLGGTGSGAVATIVVSGNQVTTVTVTDGGVGYNIGDVFTVNNALIGGGTGFVGTASSVSGSGIRQTAIINGGSGYTNGYYSNVALLGGTGVSATANIVVENGAVVSVVINSAGMGYLVNDFFGTEGAVTSFTKTSGSGYTNGTYTNIPVPGGFGQQYTANLTVSGGAVSTATTVDAGFGYKVGDVLTVAGGMILSTAITNFGNGKVPDGYYNYGTANSTSGVGRGATFAFTASGGYNTAIILTSSGYNYAVNDINYFNFGVQATVTSVSAASAIGAGASFKLTLTAVSASPMGSGTGFVGQVVTLTNPGGFINFTTVPSWVRQFNGRSWFGINPSTGIPSVIFSDVYALNCTNANQALSFGDNIPLTAAAPLGLANLLGGVVQSLIVFKSFSGIVQITGDATTNNLTVNQVPGGSGTISPRSVTEHPQGLLYLDHDGYRMVTLDGNCTDPIGVAGSGVVVPFLNPVAPTRVAAACNGTVLRVSVDSAAAGWQAYWYDTVRKVWSGPHTDSASMIDVYQDTFITATIAVPVGLFQTSAIPYSGESFTEFGSPLTWVYETVVLMDNMQMAQSEIAEMQVKSNAVTGLTSITVTALESGTTSINAATYTYPGNSAIVANRIDFNAPVVFNRLAIEITGVSKADFRIGDIFVRARTLGYIQALPV